MNEINDGRHDFDFLIGSWNSRQRRLRERLKGSTTWEEFQAKLEVHEILGGMGNVDELVMERETGVMRGVTLRLFDIRSRQWSIYWADGVHGELQRPEVGSFKDGVGEFHCQEPFEGQMIFSRFIWCNVADGIAHWEQAFSDDGGKTWETNWTADFTRA